MSDFRAPIFAIPAFMKRQKEVTSRSKLRNFNFSTSGLTLMSTQNMTQRAITNTHTHTHCLTQRQW